MNTFETEYKREIGQGNRKYATKEEAYAAHKKRVIQWAKDNPDKVRPVQQRYYYAHAKEESIKNKEYYELNKEKVKARNKAYYYRMKALKEAQLKAEFE